MLNSQELAFRMNHWSAVTGEDLLYIRLCDEDDNYALLNSDVCCGAEDHDCLCPDCQEKLHGGQGGIQKHGDLCWDTVLRAQVMRPVRWHSCGKPAMKKIIKARYPIGEEVP